MKDFNTYRSALPRNYITEARKIRCESVTEIRPPTPNELVEFVSMASETEHRMRGDWDKNKDDIKNEDENFIEQVRTGQFKAATDGNGIVIYGESSGRMYVYLLFVKPEYRHSGIALKLMNHVKKEAGGIPIALSVNGHNHAAKSLYRKLGMKDIRKFGYDGYDIIEMQSPIAESIDYDIVLGNINNTLPVFNSSSLHGAALAEALHRGYRAILEGKGMVCRIIDGTRDLLMNARGLDKELANQAVLATRHLFLDPLASPGVNPTTDPVFKKMLPLFRQLAFMMVDRFRFGTQSYRQEAAEEFSTKFVEYCRRNYAGGTPEMDDVSFNKLVDYIGGSSIEQDIGGLDYEPIPVRSWEELRMLSDRYRLGSWCNVQNEADWDRYSLYGEGRFYLLVRRGADQSKSFDKYSVIGVTLNPDGDVVFAFDRANDVVSKEIIRRIVHNAGLDSSEATGFSNAIGIMQREGVDAESVFPVCIRLPHRDYCLVGFDREKGGYCVLHDERIPHYTTDIYDSISTIDDDTMDELVVADGHLLVDYTDGNVVYDAKGMRIATEGNIFLDPDRTLLRVYEDGSSRVSNGVFMGEPAMHKLLSGESGCNLKSALFRSCVKKQPCLDRMDDTDFWVAETGDSLYIVRKPEAKLDECVRIADSDGPVDLDDVLTPDGYYRLAQYSPKDGERSYYLRKDGHNVLERPFSYIDTDGESGSFLVELEDFDGSMYIFDPNTGNIENMD